MSALVYIEREVIQMNEYEKYVEENCKNCKHKDEQDYCYIKRNIKGSLNCVNKEE